MDADLDLLLTTVFCTADDLLAEKARNARRRVTDAEVVTLCVAQAIMGPPSDRRFLLVRIDLQGPRGRSCFARAESPPKPVGAAERMGRSQSGRLRSRR
jgi:hypothetical protein